MSRLLIATALMSEAVPLIDFYRMKKQPKQAHFHLYQTAFGSDRVDIQLLVCGMGAENMQRGLSAYFTAFDNNGRTKHLNLGIAGALCEPVGKLLWAESILDTRIGLPKGVCNSAPYTVQSLPEASYHYRPGVLFDMEAESWLQCIAKNTQQFAPDDLFCAKVVSDNQNENGHKIDSHWVRNTVHRNILELEKQINKLINT